MTQEYAEQNDLATLSDLGALGEPITLAAAPDCEGRTDCQAGLENVYGIDISEILPLGYASARTFDAVLNGEAQLGQTGTTVSPQLYVAAGISGAIQHRAGMQTSRVIVAVNKDADAPIFGMADFGVVGDLFQVLPQAVEEIEKRK